MQGPGCPGIKYQQDIFLLHDHHHPAAGTATGSGSGLRSYISPSVRQDYEPPAYLVGLLFKFTFFDNWNDGYRRPQTIPYPTIPYPTLICGC